MKRSYYDTVVVGAGTTGSIIASRLSADSDRTVLVLEAGNGYSYPREFPADVLDATSFSAMLPGNPSTWLFMAQLTEEIAAPVTRGKIIGGSSAINGTIFQRGTRLDFERWVTLGNERWGFAEVLPFFNRSERDKDYPERSYHGSDGPMPVSRGRDGILHATTEAFFAASDALGYEEVEDKNAPDASGYGLLPLNVTEGVRVNTALAYLLPAMIRDNLELASNALVLRIMMSANKATGVEVEQFGKRVRVGAGEIVLCAGALKTPQLLMLSGIGPAAELRNMGIDVVADRPGVGHGLADHPELFVTYRPSDGLARRPRSRVPEAGLSFASSIPGAVDDLEIVASSYSTSTLLAPKLAGMSARACAQLALTAARTALSTSPQLLMAQFRQRNDLALALTVMGYDGVRGRVTLRSADPHDEPILAYHYLETDVDRRRARDGVKAMLDILRNPEYRGVVERITSPAPGVLESGDRGLDAWIRSSVVTAFHACRTARMGSESDPAAVVDQFGLVHGLDRLRIADTSIFPAPLSRGPHASAVMVAERIASAMHDGGESPQAPLPGRENPQSPPQLPVVKENAGASRV